MQWFKGNPKITSFVNTTTERRTLLFPGRPLRPSVRPRRDGPPAGCGRPRPGGEEGTDGGREGKADERPSGHALHQIQDKGIPPGKAIGKKSQNSLSNPIFGRFFIKQQITLLWWGNDVLS